MPQKIENCQSCHAFITFKELQDIYAKRGYAWAPPMEAIDCSLQFGFCRRHAPSIQIEDPFPIVNEEDYCVDFLRSKNF